MFDDTLRYRDGLLETPVYHLTNERTGSQIDFFGMIHIGQPSYYEAVHDLTDAMVRARGSEVHYELVKPASADELAELGLSAEELMNFSSLINAFGDLILRSLPGNTKQMGALHYRPEWQNHDMSYTELVQRMGKPNLKQMVAALRLMQESQREIPPEVVKFFIRTAFRGLPIIAPLSRILGDRTFREVIVNQRNHIATNAVRNRLAENPAQNFVMIWGAEHAPGIIGTLESMSYKLTSKYWLGALALDGARD